MLIDALICPNCGATLPPQPSEVGVVTCQYCKTSFRVPKSLTPEPDMGDLMLGADFSRKPVAGWSFPNEDNVQLIAGALPELRAHFPASDTMNYALRSSGFLDDLDVSVSLQFYEGTLKFVDAGISLRYQKGIGGYTFLISPVGTYSVGYYQKGDAEGMDWSHIVNWTSHSAIRPGLNQRNRLRVIAHSDHLRVYLNGVLATSLHDTRYTEGEVLLACETDKESALEVGFTDLQLRDVRK
jgi:hypothetical protein